MNSAVSAEELFVRKALGGGSGAKLNMFFKPTSKRGQKEQNGGGFLKERFLSPSLKTLKKRRRAFCKEGRLLTSREEESGSGLIGNG